MKRFEVLDEVNSYHSRKVGQVWHQTVKQGKGHYEEMQGRSILDPASKKAGDIRVKGQETINKI